MTVPRPVGHTFKITRAPTDHGWRLTATCTCRTAIVATNYVDLEALINDHYADARARKAQAREKEARP